jgi:hypothetical protein
MRVSKWLLLLSISVILASAILAYGQDASKKARTIDELARMYDSSSCKACHQKIYETWEKSIHAQSLIGTPRTLATLRNFITDGLMGEWKYSGVKKVEDITVEHMSTCLACHLPQIKNATDQVAQDLAKAILAGDTATLNKVSINCVICHNTKAITHKWVDGQIQPKTVYGSLVAGVHPGKKNPGVKKSPVMDQAILCGQCHGLGPNFEFQQPTQCATLYGSYLHAYVPSGGSQKCQECHMSDIKIGRNLAVKDHLIPAYRDKVQAAKAVELVVESRSYQFLPKAGDWVPITELTVKMLNKAGHRIPDG